MTRTFSTTALAAAAALLLVGAGAALAQTAEPAPPAAPAAQAAAAPADAAAPARKKAKARARTKAKPAGGSVVVMNSRTVDLTELEVAPAGSEKFKKALGKLEAGKKAGIAVTKGKDCQIDLRGTFADGGTIEASGVDVCKQRILNLTE